MDRPQRAILARIPLALRALPMWAAGPAAGATLTARHFIDHHFEPARTRLGLLA